MGETYGAMKVGPEIETDVNSNVFLADNEVSTDHTKTSQTMDVEMEIESSFKVNALLADNKVSTETEEILNRLPLHLQSFIVSHLPIKDATKTSILSKKFKSIWHSLPWLIFDFQKFPKIEGKEVIFEEFINRTLLQHDESTVILLDLSLGCREDPHPLINVEWIKFGLDHLVQYLILDGVMKDHQRLPNSLFTSSSLVTLDLSILGYVLTWPKNVLLPHLVELKLCGLIFLEENIVFDFSKASPYLEEFTLRTCIFAKAKFVYISASVRHLVLKNCLIDTGKVKLRTPALTYFEYDNALESGFDFEGLRPKIVLLPHLVELKLCGLIFLEENIVFDFSKASPYLEEFTLRTCIFAKAKFVYISASVRHLVLKHCLIDTCKVKLRTPALTYFEYDTALASGFDFEGLRPKFSCIINVHETDHLGRGDGDIARCAVNLYTELRNASVLFTRPWFIQYLIQGEAILNMKPILFNHLRTLNVSILATVEQYKMIIFILSSCPNLASLVIKFVSVFEILALDDVALNWKDMLHYEICASLDYLEVENLQGSIGQMGLVEFLLLKACEVGHINISPPKTIDNLGNSIITISKESWNAITARVLEFKRASGAHISYEYQGDLCLPVSGCNVCGL